MANERKFIAENVRRVLLKEYLMKEVTRAGFGGLDVQRTPMGTRVTLITERPGIVIGRRGAAIKNLTRAIEEDFKFDNPQVEVKEVANPNLNAQIMAEKLAFALERGWHFRRAGHSTIRRVMDSGARGCHIIIAGKLTGQRHRTEKFKEGYIKFCGEPKLTNVERGYAVAKLKPGVIGVTVEIMRPDTKLPDEIDVIEPAVASEKFPELAPLMVKKEEPSVIVPNAERDEEPAPEGEGVDDTMESEQ
ncbi:MAG: 30S ribosomal protein S3 [Methanomassiliicoccus sp.]|nr:30S ribosomal protein S3 [Methanomassiliicoccus sp.]